MPKTEDAQSTLDQEHLEPKEDSNAESGESGCRRSVCMARARRWARAVKRDVIALWIACRDPRVLWYAKVVAGVVAAYALSPIDLIPDFVPVLGLCQLQHEN